MTDFNVFLKFDWMQECIFEISILLSNGNHGTGLLYYTEAEPGSYRYCKWQALLMHSKNKKQKIPPAGTIESLFLNVLSASSRQGEQTFRNS